MPCGSRAFDGRLGATRKELLELENFGWEVGETEWEDDQVCIGWLGRLVGAPCWHAGSQFDLGCDLEEYHSREVCRAGVLLRRHLICSQKSTGRTVCRD